MPRMAALAIAAGPADTPPVAITPTSANCDPPVNISRLITQVCQMSRPAPTASAPYDTPYAAAARPTARPARIAAASALLLVTTVDDHEGGCVRPHSPLQLDAVNAIVIAQRGKHRGD